jgi:hypothetical protein
MIKKYEVLRPFFGYKKDDKIVSRDCTGWEFALINFLLEKEMVKEIEEFPEWLSNMDEFVKFLESKYRLVLSFGPYEKVGEHLEPLILSQWLPEFAEHYNGGATDCKWSLTSYGAGKPLRFNCFNYEESNFNYMPLGTVLFKDADFLQLFIDNAPQEVKDYLKGEQ